MTTIFVESSPIVQSLVEKKKLQWAREREELAGLNENAPWGSRESIQLYERPYLRSRHATKYQKEVDCYLRGDPPRRQSLPPLYKNQNFTYTSNEKLDKEMGGETSGYGSDNPNHTPEHFPQTSWGSGGQQQNLGGYESSSSGRDDRLKWGDRGVHVGKFWEPKEVDNFAKSNDNTDDTPGWVKRGLERETELVVSNTSPAESPEQDFGERPCTGSSSSQINKCYIRGQNVPVDSTELAERERRRQIALAHQEAIRKQLEEREKYRQDERSRRLQEEYEEERRIAREQQLETRRKEEEQRLRDEKEERDRRRKEALREAIAIAEKQAKEEKLKQKLMRQNILENFVEVDKIKPVNIEPEEDELNNTQKQYILEINKEVENNNHFNKEIYDSNKNINQITTTTTAINNNNNVSTETSSDNDTASININNERINNAFSLTFSHQQVSQENLALVLQNPLESLQNMQLAVLIPANNSLPIAIPLATTERNSINTARTENRLLTPTQYRNNKRLCDSSTQTEPNENEKYVREKLANLEISYECRSRKERRSRSEFRESVEERPKWGVNRPPTRYLKQSEKDPLYQRRKMRQKMRQINDKCRNYSPHSSDDSQVASPRTYRKKGYTEKRHSRALWRKNEQLFAENVRVYQTEIIPLESDRDHIYFKAKASNHHHCCCRCNKKDKSVDILKIDHNSPRDCPQYKNEHKLPQCSNNSSLDDGVLDKLNSIHHGLMLKSDRWVDDDSRTSIIYSPSRNP